MSIECPKGLEHLPVEFLLLTNSIYGLVQNLSGSSFRNTQIFSRLLALQECRRTLFFFKDCYIIGTKEGDSSSRFNFLEVRESSQLLSILTMSKLNENILVRTAFPFDKIAGVMLPSNRGAR
jgi:hypothetical protein